ncbi:MAG: RDD family protein [Verrucomicrobiota bacterium]
MRYAIKLKANHSEMEVYIERDGEQSGPHTMYQIRQLLETGEIDSDTLGWMRDQEGGWKPLHDIPPVKRVINEIAQRKLDERLAETKRPQPSPEPLHQTPAGISRHAFSRFAARYIDVTLFQILVCLALYGRPELPADFGQELMPKIDQDKAENLTLVLFFVGMSWQLIEGILLATFGTTPGKALLQLQLRRPDGAKLEMGVSILRSVYVWILGMGMGVWILPIVANLLGFIRLHSRGITIWDEQLKVEVHQRPLDSMRKPFVLIMLITVTMIWGFLVAAYTVSKS